MGMEKEPNRKRKRWTILLFLLIILLFTYMDALHWQDMTPESFDVPSGYMLIA